MKKIQYLKKIGVFHEDFIFYLDNNKCDTKNSNIILYIHHILNIFANFGWLSSNKVILYIYLLNYSLLSIYVCLKIPIEYLIYFLN